jgi:inosine-uridine nucleoside N-ribohydrolase
MDYNVQLDVASAKYVLEHSHPTLIPLNITVETALRRAYLPQLEQAGALGRLLAHQAEVHGTVERNEERLGKTYAGTPDDLLNFQHDPLACAIALGWNGVKKAVLPLTFEIQNGLLVERVAQEGKPTTVVVEVDGNAFNSFWLETVTQER